MKANVMAPDPLKDSFVTRISKKDNMESFSTFMVHLILGWRNLYQIRNGLYNILSIRPNKKGVIDIPILEEGRVLGEVLTSFIAPKPLPLVPLPQAKFNSS